MSTYRYQLIQKSWGISIEIRASIEVSAVRNPSNGDSRVWRFLSIDDLNDMPRLRSAPVREVRLTEHLLYLSGEEQQYLQKGLELVSDQLPPQQNIVVTVEDLNFNETDYQPEGLALALAGLLQQHFHLRDVHVPVHYLPEQNRYYFDFEHARFPV